MGVYFFPLLGGWLSDRCWGKYKTILWLSLVYCAGHAFLAIFEKSRAGFGVMAFRMFFFAAFAFAAAIAFGFSARRYKSVGHYRSS